MSIHFWGSLKSLSIGDKYIFFFFYNHSFSGWNWRHKKPTAMTAVLLWCLHLMSHCCMFFNSDKGLYRGNNLETHDSCAISPYITHYSSKSRPVNVQCSPCTLTCMRDMAAKWCGQLEEGSFLIIAFRDSDFHWIFFPGYLFWQFSHSLISVACP